MLATERTGSHEPAPSARRREDPGRTRPGGVMTTVEPPAGLDLDRPRVDLTGLPPEQAFALGELTAHLIAAAEVRGYRNAIAKLRAEGTRLLNAGALAVEHHFAVAADFLEAQ